VTEAGQLRDRLKLMRAREVPLPLDRVQAVRRASELRTAGLSFTDATIVLELYHGQRYTFWQWRDWVRQAGLPASRGARR
jgi:hypothetical protein